jgi:serine acetyltransferase
VVLRDIPDDCLVAGNPARVVRKGLRAGRFGRLPKVDKTEYQQQLEEVMRSLLRKVGR